MVCYIAPTAKTPPVFGVVFLCPDSKHLSCVRNRLPFYPTECASIRCHSSDRRIMEQPTSYNINWRRSSQVGDYRPGIWPLNLLAVRLGRQLSVGILSRLLPVDRKAQRKLRRSP